MPRRGSRSGWTPSSPRTARRRGPRPADAGGGPPGGAARAAPPARPVAPLAGGAEGASCPEAAALPTEGEGNAPTGAAPHPCHHRSFGLGEDPRGAGPGGHRLVLRGQPADRAHAPVRRPHPPVARVAPL